MEKRLNNKDWHEMDVKELKSVLLDKKLELLRIKSGGERGVAQLVHDEDVRIKKGEILLLMEYIKERELTATKK